MEWSWRTVLILVGLLAIAAIIVDGFRRMKRARAEALRLDIQPGLDDLGDDDYNPELPGSVRVVSDSPAADSVVRREPSFGDVAPTSSEALARSEKPTPPEKPEPSQPPEPAEQLQTSEQPDPEHSPERFSAQEEESDAGGDIQATISGSDDLIHTEPSAAQPERSPLIPTVKPVDLDEKVPVLLDVEELGDERSFEEGIVSAPRVVSGSDEVESPEATATEAADDSEVDEPVSENIVDDQDDLPEVEDPDNVNDPHLEQEVESVPDESVISQPVNYAGAGAEVLANRPEPELVLVIHTIARDPDGFNGRDLLFLFNSCDLRYGEKDIFHRFEEADGEGRIQFSVAQVRNPGTFDPSHMADQRFMGLSFFMSLPGAKRPLEAYEAMSEMAMVVSRNLSADVLDESHSAMTPQTMEHERQQILEYERQQRLAAKKRV